MNKQTEALKMAIDWMEHPFLTGLNRIEVIQSCKEALEQPAQEPVLYIDQGGLDGHATWAQPNACQNTDIPLYTHPAPSWQGLSDDEMMEIWCSDEVESTLDFGRAIEQALKEKNT